MKCKYLSHTDRGFTLVETIVVLLIVGIMMTIAAPSFVTWLSNKEVDEALASVEGALREAQSTSIRRNKTCNILVTSNTVSAVTAALAPDSNCLPSGSRQIESSSANLAITGTGGSTGTLFQYSSRGTVNITPSTETVIVYQTDNLTNGAKKCIVVSSGIGILKTGKYIGTIPLTLSTPATQAEVDFINSQCRIDT